MKKFLIFVVVLVAAYFVYDQFIKEKEMYSIEANYVKNRESVDLDAPAIQPRDFAHYEGKIKNISDKLLSNVIITYLIDAKPSSANIGDLKPGEEKNFTSSVVMLRNIDPSHYLKEVTFIEN